ncbi:hypothetical protein [Burkholderia vietnamiensis]|uniref:hypothetical protein n=1 Tax=Burkholderia vietnamiensis TaxID=60552 RepID=UPI001CF14F02|nr:hypothetical protein [Burkholderia vietnamiensis]MCA8148085.1 hypothetical protein [Burkholderia vietnamiensis]
MAHLTDTIAQAKPRRSSRPKASQEQVSNVNTQEGTMTTSTAAAPAADATFADVADATGNTGTAEGTTAAAPAPAGKAPEADKPKVHYLRVFVLATTAAGTHEFFTTIVGATDEEIVGKKHLSKATRKAMVEGYRWPMTPFDERSAAARQLDVMAGRQADAMSRA